LLDFFAANSALARRRKMGAFRMISWWNENPMKTIKLTLTSLTIILATALPSLAVPRVFVSGHGNDTNPGSLTSPKRSFSSALSVTDAGGEIVVLDSAGYGPVTINKSVTVNSPLGVYAGVTVTSGDGIDVSAGSSDTVILRGLTINGVGGSTGNGIRFISGAALHVESCVINGFNNGSVTVAGILSNSTGQLFVKDTISRGNDEGIEVNQGQASLDQVRMEGNLDGLFAAGGKTSVRNSVASGNTFDGFVSAGASTELNIENCMAANNSSGISEALATVRISNCTVTDNTNFGVAANGGFIESRGNNTVRGNGTDVSATITPISGI
jgi:hypothetical protein